jgi:aspartate aminotransferase
MDFSANIARLQPSATIAVSSLAKKLRREGRDIIDLSAGEPDFDTPAFVSEAAIEGIRTGRTRYTPVPGMPEIRAAVAGFLGRTFGIEADPEGVVVSAGAKQSLFNAVFSLAGPGDEVMIATPYWTSYPQMVTLSRAEPVFVQGTEEVDFRLTPSDLTAARTERTRALILCTPSNPTGTVYSMEELRAVSEWCRDHDVILIADEIYRAIYYGGDRDRAPGILDLPDDSRGTWVLIDGASKAFAMTGWRIGFSYTEPEMAKKFSALQSQMTSNASTPSQVAAMAAFGRPEQADAAVREMVGAFRRRRDLVARLMGELLPETSLVEPRGAFYVFFRIDCFEGCPPDSAEFCSWLLEETGVATVPGVAFGDDRYARLSFATSDEMLEDGIQRIAAAVHRKGAAATGRPTSSADS